MSKIPPPEPCPSKGKRKFSDRETAEASLTTIWRNAGRHGPGGRLPCRAYLCRCGNWHLTSRPLDYLRPLAGEVVSSPSPTNPMNG